MGYTLGLDIGVASVGFAVLENNLDQEPVRIIDLGVRVFDKAEHPKDGSSLAAPRREARSARRRIRRCRHRKERIRQLIVREGIMAEEEMTALFSGSGFERDVYELRVDGLDRLLSKEELVRLLIHFAQRRGYQSNSKSQEAKDEKESGKLHAALSKNRRCMEENGYRTVGEMLVKDPRFYITNPDGTHIRKVHNTPDDYKLTQERSEIIREIRMIFDAQCAMGSPYITGAFADQYLEIFASQRNFDEGPGGNSVYGGNQIEKMWGMCSLEKDQLRAAKASYTFEYFKLLQDINHIRLVQKGGVSRELTPEQREALISKAHGSANITYAQIRKLIHMEDGCLFNTLYYGSKTVEEQEKQKFPQLQAYHKIRTAVEHTSKGSFAGFTPDMLDEIGRVLSIHKSDDKRIAALKEAGIPELYYPELLKLSFSKSGHLSVLAMKKMIPYLEQGVTYDKAKLQVYGERVRTAQRTDKLSLKDLDEDITNPVVRRAVSQSIKVINAITRTYGQPEKVRIELARELGKSFEDRNKITKRQDENFARNEQLREQIKEYKCDHVTGMDLVKFKLYTQQDGVCLYSGEQLDIARLFEPGYVDVDHIVPYSICFDDSYDNKVLVKASENRMKGNRLPYQYFGQDPERWHQFEVLVNSKIHSHRKRANLLLQVLSEDRVRGFRERNLVDTQYLSRVIYRLVNEHMVFADTAGKRPVQSVSGNITAYVRKRLGIEKHREDGDCHHAVDAVVIGCISDGMIQRITRYAQLRERYYLNGHGYVDRQTGEVLSKQDFDRKYAPEFPTPWPQFRRELEARMADDPQQMLDMLHLNTYEEDSQVRPLFVSRMPNHKVTGAAHQETVRSGKVPGCTVTKVPLQKLKLGKDGQIEGYYNPESDRLLYEALRERLAQFGGKGDKAFTEPFYKPKKDGTPGNRVEKVKILEKSTLNVPVNRGKGIAANGAMVRVDIYRVENDGYYAIPIYVADTKAQKLPDRAAVAHKAYRDWKVMADEDFLFSLFPGDLIYVQQKRGIPFTAAKGSSFQEKIIRQEGYFYYSGFDISAGAISLDFHDRSYAARGVGLKTLQSIRKYQVDVLGNISEVRLPEKRLGF